MAEPGTSISASQDVGTHAGPWRRYVNALFAPSPIAPLVYFRVIFGAIMLWEVTRYFEHGWIERYYVDPEFFFHYMGFSWVKPWPDNWPYIHFLGLGILATFIMLGLFYRASTILFFLGFTQVFLSDQANYLNHFYLVSLLSFMMIFLPTHRAGSLDVLRRPELRATTLPAWPLLFLRAQIAIPYIYGGIAKINPDWLRGEPIGEWLSDRTDFPIIGAYFETAWAPYAFAYGGLLLDLFVVPFLLWRRTRLIALGFAVTFHLMNAQLFTIGIFPWFMIGATFMFCSPERFQGFLRRLERFLSRAADTGEVIWEQTTRRRLTTALITVYLAVQLLVPFRHWLYSGNVSWTEEGHNFSWHMKLRDKGGSISFRVTDPAKNRTWVVNHRKYLSSRQRRKMTTRPDMIVLFAHYLEEQLRDEDDGDLEIRVLTKISLNGRDRQPLIDPTVDLTQVHRSLAPSPWIVPLEKELPPRETSQ